MKKRELLIVAILYFLCAVLTWLAFLRAEAWRRVYEYRLRSEAFLEGVGWGETAWEIAQRQGGDPRRTLDEMKALNPGKDLGRLRPGEQIWVPGGAENDK